MLIVNIYVAIALLLGVASRWRCVIRVKASLVYVAPDEINREQRGNRAGVQKWIAILHRQIDQIEEQQRVSEESSWLRWFHVQNVQNWHSRQNIWVKRIFSVGDELLRSKPNPNSRRITRQWHWQTHQNHQDNELATEEGPAIVQQYCRASARKLAHLAASYQWGREWNQGLCLTI